MEARGISAEHRRFNNMTEAKSIDASSFYVLSGEPVSGSEKGKRNEFCCAGECRTRASNVANDL